MIRLIPIKTEDMFCELLHLESRIYAKAHLKRFPMHPQSSVADRFLFGNPNEVFQYAYLLKKQDVYIGYANAYLEESEFSVVLLSGYERFYSEALSLLEKLTSPGKTKISLHINTTDLALCQAAEQLGFQHSANESRWQAALSLKTYEETAIEDSKEYLERLSKADIPVRAKYSALPTGHIVTVELYETFWKSEYYNTANEYVIRLKSDDTIVGFLTWWIDESAKTVSLEAVATLPNFRRQGIMYRAIIRGLNQFKNKDFQYAYVSTGSENPARYLYQSVGFDKLGKVYLFKKDISHV